MTTAQKSSISAKAMKGSSGTCETFQCSGQTGDPGDCHDDRDRAEDEVERLAAAQPIGDGPPMSGQARAARFEPARRIAAANLMRLRHAADMVPPAVALRERKCAESIGFPCPIACRGIKIA